MRLFLCLLLPASMVTLASQAHAAPRPLLDGGPLIGRTSTLRDVTSGDGTIRQDEVAGGFGGRLGVSGDHFVAGASLDVWTATASAVSAAVFGGLAARSPGGFAVEVTGVVGGAFYDGYVSGGFYTDVETTSVQLPFAGGRLQTWVPLGSKVSLGFFAEARTDLQKGTGTASIIHRCTFLCDVVGGHDSAPELHTFAVGGQTYFGGINVRFTGKAPIPPPSLDDRE